MRKLINIVLITIGILSLTGCGGNVQYYFTSEGLEVQEEYLVLKVFDTGNSRLAKNVTVEVSTEVVAATGCPEFVIGEYARVVMARNLERRPDERLDALAIFKIDEVSFD